MWISGTCRVAVVVGRYFGRNVVRTPAGSALDDSKGILGFTVRKTGSVAVELVGLFCVVAAGILTRTIEGV